MSSSKFNQIFGRNLLKFRKNKHISQTELANALDVSRVTISNAEAGKYGLGHEKIALTAALLGCSVSDLFPTLQELGVEVPELINIKAKIKEEAKIAKIEYYKRKLYQLQREVGG